MKNSTRFSVLFVVIVLAPMIIGGGYGEGGGGCSCTDDYESSSYSPSPQRHEEPAARVPPAECTPFLAQERQAAFQRGLEEGRRQTLAEFQAEQPEPQRPQLQPAPQPSAQPAIQPASQRTHVIATYRVPRGGSYGSGVRKYARQGADLDATLVCNGHQAGFRGNIPVFRGQKIKICGWSN